MIGYKYWNLRKGTLEVADSLHLVAPLIKVAHNFATEVYNQVHIQIQPSVSNLWSECMLIGYNTTATLAKKFAKLANEIKGKGVLPETHKTSFLFAYLKNQE